MLNAYRQLTFVRIMIMIRLIRAAVMEVKILACRLTNTFPPSYITVTIVIRQMMLPSTALRTTHTCNKSQSILISKGTSVDHSSLIFSYHSDLLSHKCYLKMSVSENGSSDLLIPLYSVPTLFWPLNSVGWQNESQLCVSIIKHRLVLTA